MTLCVAITSAMMQHIRGPARYLTSLEIPTVADFISNEFKAMLGNLQFIEAAFRKFGGFGRNIRMMPIDELARCQI